MTEKLKRRLTRAEQKAEPSLFGSLDLVKYVADVTQEMQRLATLSPEEFDLELAEAMKKAYPPFNSYKTALMLTYQKRREEEEEGLKGPE